MAGKGARSGIYGLIAIYLLAVHVLLFLALFHPDVIDDQRWRAPWLPAGPERNIAQAHAMFRAMETDRPSGRLLLIGDSQMQRMDTSLLARPALNFGIGGDRLAAMAERLHAYDYRERASAVVLWGGVNDLLRGDAPKDVAAALGDVRAYMPVAKPLYVVAISPVRSGLETGLTERIAATNRLLAQGCRGACRFVDTTARLSTAAGTLVPDYDSGDGLHLNRRGHAQVAAALDELLARTAPERSAS